MFFARAFSIPQTYRTTPVPILKQINRQNDDGSYSYGYEAADGTFKIETKFPTGEVYGKYGYVGDDGKIRQVEYGASKRGFEPVGADINVAPPTLTNTVDNTNPDREDDGQYREDPSIYYKETSNQNFSPVNQIKSTYQTSFPRYYQPRYYQSPAPLSNYYNSQPRYQPVRINYDPAIFKGHPATNIDINTGSYSVSYST